MMRACQDRAVILSVCNEGVADHGAQRSAAAIVEELPSLDASLIHRATIARDRAAIRHAADTWIGRCDLFIAIGGTEIAQDDVTPDVLEPLIERRLPGFGELLRLKVYEDHPNLLISRCGAGIARDTLVLWLMDSPDLCRKCLTWLTPAIRGGVCVAEERDRLSRRAAAAPLRASRSGGTTAGNPVYRNHSRTAGLAAHSPFLAQYDGLAGVTPGPRLPRATLSENVTAVTCSGGRRLLLTV